MKVSGYLKLFGGMWICLLLVGWIMGLITLTRMPVSEADGLWWGAVMTGCMFLGLLPGALLMAVGQGLETLDKILYELKRRKV